MRAAKKSTSEENLRRRRPKNQREKPFMKIILGREGVELQINYKAASDENLRRRRQEQDKFEENKV